MKKFLDGKKTHIIAGLVLSIEFVKFITGDLTLIEFLSSENLFIILGGLGLSSLRVGIKKSGVNIILILLLPLLLTYCSSQAIVNYSPPVNEKYGIDETAQIVDALYNTYSEVRGNLESLDAFSLALSTVPQMIDAAKGISIAKEEIKDLSDNEVLLLVSIGNHYDLGLAKEKIQQVFKVCLFLVQSYFKFYPRKEMAFYNNIYQLYIYVEKDKKYLAAV